jgi:(1->4)-alpha-D-glucan 1-alpha-D-glucosylmutase
VSSIPTATYRLQMSAHLHFDQVRQLVPYFADLGIGALYLSPIFRAAQGSTHGYDVVDPRELDPQLGSEEDFAAMAEELRAHGLGLLLDVVPNHMGIDDPHNVWWRDVLANGRASPFATYFDIDWHPPKRSLEGKVLLPVLGESFGKVLESQQLKLVYENDAFFVRYYERAFPTDPQTWVPLLELCQEKLLDSSVGDSQDRSDELELLIIAFSNFATSVTEDGEVDLSLIRAKNLAARHLATLSSHGEVRDAIDAALQDYNGRLGEPASFDQLEAFLVAQPYRLCYWRAATDEINYRRFFDVDTLAAIRVEDPRVFRAVHQSIFRFIDRGWVTGLRIDHADGLRDPKQYLTDLRQHVAAIIRSRDTDLADAESEEAYLVVEKILAADESIPQDWPAHGTTGYEFLNTLNHLFVDSRGLTSLNNIYAKFTDEHRRFSEILYECKRTVMATSLSSEIYVLSQQLARMAEKHRWSKDLTRPAMHRALREIIGCFPVYRTYTLPGATEVRDEDRRRIQEAVRVAKRRNPAASPEYFDFIASILLLEDPENLSEANRTARREFVFKFQQVTGPVTAKGLEDTAFYRFYPLASKNEVGGNPALLPPTVDQFHDQMEERLARWPHSMSASATHDTKRGEDTRARLNVLSEIPTQWQTSLDEWHELNAGGRVEQEGSTVPDANEEYLLYQTLIGTWPVEPMQTTDRVAYQERILQYMTKALREAKVHTGWLNPDVAYEQAISDFVRLILDAEKSPFVAELDSFVRTIADAGFVNSLAQTLVKICAPGLPDFYQGTEFWDFSLVDPDNRRTVDFVGRRDAVRSLITGQKSNPRFATELLQKWPDPRLKLLLIWRALQFRRDHAAIFNGGYQPLVVDGPRKSNVGAFARTTPAEWTLCLFPISGYQAWHDMRNGEIAGAKGAWPVSGWWSETVLLLPDDAPRSWRHEITGDRFTSALDDQGRTVLDVARILSCFPVALLSSV